MAKKKSTGNDQFGLNMPIDLSALLQIQQSGLNTLQDMHKAFVKGTAAYNEELLSFLNKRFKEDIEACGQFANCSKPQDVYEVYSKFLQKTMTQYMEEAEKISNLGSKMLGDTMNVFEKSEPKKAKKTKTKTDSEEADV